MAAPETPAVPVEPIMEELRERIRERLRHELLLHGASPALEDPVVFAHVEELLREATRRRRDRALLLHEYLGDPSTWRLEPALKLGSHRGAFVARLLLGVKRKVLLPVLRWFFEYTHDNFARQQHVNEVLFAIVQDLAIQNAELRRDLDRLERLERTKGA
jgi:hypothetical protein